MCDNRLGLQGMSFDSRHHPLAVTNDSIVLTPNQVFEYYVVRHEAEIDAMCRYGGHNVVLEIQATLPSPPYTLVPYMRGVYICYFVISICYCAPQDLHSIPQYVCGLHYQGFTIYILFIFP
jgi:hypothetical protein